MKHVPKLVSDMDNKQLNALAKLLSGKGSDSYREFCQLCVEASMKSILEVEPEGASRDYYLWGYRKGLLEAHRLYRRLGEFVEDELANRKEIDAKVTAE